LVGAIAGGKARKGIEAFMELGRPEILGLILAASFAAGLNVYATVATLGLLARYELLQLPASLGVLDDWWVIGAAALMFVVEFFADKVPAFDMLWNALHTFVRIPAAAVIAYAAAAPFSGGEQIASALVGGSVAMAAHGGKMAARAAVTPSPEPISNVGLSLIEDAIAIGLVWFAVNHPYIAAGIALALVVLTVLLVRWVWRALRNLFRGARRELQQLQRAG
jgi:hypothetical protein